MYKVLIADDEAIFREYMRTLLNWEQLGFSIICEAKNGLEALEKICEMKPDLALVDINMPYLNGISLIEKIKELGIMTAIILITGHSEFEYARKAIRLGVVDYILKPFHKEELIMTLLKVKGNLKQQQDERDEAKGKLELMKERYLNLMISGELIASDIDISNKLSQFGITLDLPQLVVTSIEIDDMYILWSDAEEILLWKFAVANILNELLGDDIQHITFSGPEGRILTILALEENDHIAKHMEKFRKAYSLIRQYMKFDITIGIGNPSVRFRTVRKSYLESLVALQNKVSASDSRIILASSITQDNMRIGFYPNEVDEKLLIALRTNDQEEVRQLLEDVFQYIRVNRLSSEYVYVIIMGLASLCLSFVYESGKNADMVFGKDFSPFTEIRSQVSLDALFKWSMHLFERSMKGSDDGRNSKSKKIIESVMEYIAAYYGDSSLSVEGIANGIYLNSSYLRKVFKKELNMTVNDYIVDFRMMKAKELIGCGNIKLSDISEMVGYNDAGYFSKSFKKKYGFSPSDYENQKN